MTVTEIKNVPFCAQIIVHLFGAFLSILGISMINIALRFSWLTFTRN